MHPASTAVLVLGYALAIPIGFKLAAVVKERRNLAFLGHQFGMILAAVGWFMRGSTAVGVGHLLWLVGTRLWYAWAK